VSKVITWVDLQGRYRITSSNAQDDAALDVVWSNIIVDFTLPADHPKFYIERSVLKAKTDTLEKNEFRYAGKPDANGQRDGTDGAWEMDTDGTPKVNMAKARGVHMDVIRIVRNTELAAKDITFMRAVEAGDTSAQATIATEKQVLRDIPQTFDLTTATPEQLKAKWPAELPARE
jgi:hypothetical protein